MFPLQKQTIFFDIFFWVMNYLNVSDHVQIQKKNLLLFLVTACDSFLSVSNLWGNNSQTVRKEVSQCDQMSIKKKKAMVTKTDPMMHYLLTSSKYIFYFHLETSSSGA